jgi:hypothetical protein
VSPPTKAEITYLSYKTLYKVIHFYKMKYSFYLALALSFFACNAPESTAADVTPATAAKTISEPVPPPNPAVNKDTLMGSWVRTDAPYNLNIAGFAADGTMKVAYLNPKSINVGRANWTLSNGTISIYVELRDENYPGSHYTLYYMPERDLLAGKYFQAVEGVTYDVGFMRAK